LRSKTRKNKIEKNEGNNCYQSYHPKLVTNISLKNSFRLIKSPLVKQLALKVTGLLKSNLKIS